MRIGGHGGIEIDERGVRAGAMATSDDGQSRALALATTCAVSPSEFVADLQRLPAARGLAIIVAVASTVGSAGMAIGILLVGAPLPLLIAPLAALGISGGLIALWRRVSGIPAPYEIERELLDVAAASGGSVTVAQAARALGRPLVDVEAALCRIVTAGHASADIDESVGVVRYRFVGLEQSPSRSRSRNTSQRIER